MIISGILRHLKVVEIPKETGGTREILQLFFDEETLLCKNFHSVFVQSATDDFLSAYTRSREMYVSVTVRSIVHKQSQSGRNFTNYFGEVGDWKILS